MTALLNSFRCGSKRHQTAECFRNHKICFRCQYRGHVAIECVSNPSDRLTIARNNGRRNEKNVPTSFISTQQNHEFTMAHHNTAPNPSPSTTQEGLIPKRRERIIDKGEPKKLSIKFNGDVYMGRLENAKYDTDKKLEEMQRRCE